MSASEPTTTSSQAAAEVDASVRPGHDPAQPDVGRPLSPRLSLTDFLELTTLQEIQDSFAAVTRISTSIRDPEGTPLTLPTNAETRARSDQWLDHLLSPTEEEGDRYSAPIVVAGQELGAICLEPDAVEASTGVPEARARFEAIARRLKLDDDQIAALVDSAEDSFSPARAASIQFLYLMANAVARLCYEQYQAQQRIDELSTLYKVSTLLSAQRDVQQVLEIAASSIAEVLQAKAASVRLIRKHEGANELVPRAVYNLSDEYLNKGPIRVDKSELFQQAIDGEVPYVEDMATDPRIIYPEDARREGLVSMLCAAMVHHGKPIGLVQLFTDEKRKFTNFEVQLLRAMAQMLGTAIENAKLDQARMENQRMMRQLHLAADVQRRMLPGSMPHLPPFDIAARYVPSFELGGDFYDFIDLDGHLGVAVGDVVGKGVAASLLMASVRASLRAYAQDVYDLDEVIARVNIALCRDTTDREFATLWYGVFDPRTRRLTYSNAGHEPTLLLRRGKVQYLGAGGMLAGVDPAQEYDKGLVELQAGDVLLLYSDGLVDAFNFKDERFGRDRIVDALREAADRSAGEVLNHILWCMRRFTGMRRSLDDTTLVVIKVGQSG
ncbi:SpoIIE family protein phosphatase [Phycisphaerales bacterium AB-hyl4]|uniref:SpoIIE family protein phosphatase n=1 Tax=Natronomicrosphaera hydrolytica TaxID=3242702 RepID=A0ABV4U317_9BACT